MRILVDENLPRSLAERLRRAGHDAVDWGLLVVRMPKCAIGAVMARIEEVLGAVEEFHLRGYLTIVEPARIRRRRVRRKPRSASHASSATFSARLPRAPSASWQARPPPS